MIGHRKVEFLAFIALLAAGLVVAGQGSGPERLLPSLPGWAAAESPQRYLPESLFEYINGAAESYLSYDFQELAVGRFKKAGSPGELTVEVYDMGSSRNAFGIYGAERYPESSFLEVGDQGYREEGSLNFLAGRYYIKLMCYDCGAESRGLLEEAARRAAAAVPERTGLPTVLAAFPSPDRVANSEKFVLKNFMGQSFLEAGYTAQYRRGDREFECYIIEAQTADAAELMLGRLTDPSRTAPQPMEGLEGAVLWKDKYLGNMFVVRSGRYLCGLSRVPDDLASRAPDYLTEMLRALSGPGR